MSIRFTRLRLLDIDKCTIEAHLLDVVIHFSPVKTWSKDRWWIKVWFYPNPERILSP